MFMKNVFFLKPHFEDKIWGGSNLKKLNYQISNDHVGEAWIISGYPNKSSIITNGKYKNKTLQWLFENHPEYFSNTKSNVYPLLIKILDSNDKLSIQVHPDDNYAQKHYHELGKNECWYILDARKNASIVYGHNAKTKKELVSLIKNNKWNELLRIKKVKKGDFIYVPAGTVHAINGGLLIYELQQSSDLTFRLYDYNRLNNGKPRPLHIKESIDVITVPHKDYQADKGSNVLVSNEYFKLVKLDNHIKTKYTFSDAQWLQVTVVSGSGILNNKKNIKAGDSFIIGSPINTFSLSGNLTVLVGYIAKNRRILEK